MPNNLLRACILGPLKEHQRWECEWLCHTACSEKQLITHLVSPVVEHSQSLPDAASPSLVSVLPSRQGCAIMQGALPI
jgi:hypothetical protein